ncbi:putative ERCC4 domain-containing protein [Azospirillaceae bacterium]
MKILIDTREQQELIFDHPFITEIIHTKLDLGDYACILEDGYKIDWVFERKNLGDLYGSLSKGYKRLKKRINEAIANKIGFIIIIEASLTKVSKGYSHSTRSGNEIVQQLFTLYTKHNIPFHCCNTPEEASLFITNFYLSIGKEHIKQLKLKSRETVPTLTK